MPFCGNCGIKLSETAKFCSNCGLAIKASEGQELVQKDETNVESISTILDLLRKSDSYKFYDFEKYFGAIAAHSNRLYLSDDIPFDKLDAFIGRFKRKILNVGYLENFSHHLYYDDTTMGKGDIGYVISSDKNKNKLFLLAMDVKWAAIFDFSFISSICWKKGFGMNLIYSDNALNLTYLDNGVGKSQTVGLPIVNKQFGDAIIAFYKAYFDINSKELSVNSPKKDVAAKLPPIETNISPIKPKDGAGIR